MMGLVAGADHYYECITTYELIYGMQTTNLCADILFHWLIHSLAQHLFEEH